jgi:type I restriction enzyme, R subunit
METPSFKEDHISQIPALQMLLKLGYKYLSTEEALALRGNKTTSVILEDVLRKQLKEINSPRISSTRTTYFSDSNIENGIQALKDLPMNEGYIVACETAYNILTLGKALEQSIDGDKKSFTLQYIDWNPQTFLTNNIFHVTEEFSVMRSTSKEHYRPDIVLFINGIPFCIIECKRPDLKEPLVQAISQQLRSQQEDGIRALYVYAQIMLSIATDSALFATNGTPEKFWSKWEEKFDGSRKEVEQQNDEYVKNLLKLKNQQLLPEQKNKLFAERYKYVRHYFDALEKETVLPTIQDEYLLGLCEPQRLLDFAYNFILFDNGEKKIARYQQFFAVKKAMKRISHLEGGKRKGGVIWHTQGSGKSLTMVMLAQAIALDKNILNPKIILVTDRTDLDEQITGTFRKCGMIVDNASTGQRLADLLLSKSDAVVTTIINKFETALKRVGKLENPNIFVLVDEGHRTQHGTFNIDMQKTLPNACFIAFTGTPLFKKDKKTSDVFGGEIDRYTVDKAVKDKAVVPLLYEGRHAFQHVNEKAIDTFFNLVSEPLNDIQKADLKRKFSRADQLNIAEQKIYAICWDISQHFRDNFQGKTPFKGQLVTQTKEAAIRYKNFLDEIGIVTTEVVISPPDEREGEDSAYAESSDRVKIFWKKMMDEHGNAKRYDKNIISRFKNQKDPEIIIVVDKLLTGFDVPQNTVLYLTRKLQGHTLLQAIARVNRIYPDKDYGYIIDYYGVLGALDEALEIYSSFDEFDKEDLEGTLNVITDEIKKLPQKHSEVWDIFKTIGNKKDAEAYQQLLRDEAIRVVFYDKLAAFARILKMALSSIQFHKQTEEKTINRYKEDIAFFLKLRSAVLQRYSDNIDYKQYEGQIQKLIDTHIQTEEVKIITELVDIFDREKFQQEVEKTISLAAKADKIASRTAKHISEKMEEDPAFYKKFSELLKDTIREYEEKRLSELQYLNKVKDLMESVLSRTDSDIPETLRDKDIARAFYGIGREGLNDKLDDEELLKVISSEIALSVDEIIKKLMKVDWQNPSNIDIQKKMIHLIGDYLIDEVRNKYKLDISYDEIDMIAERCLDVAKIRYKQ